LLPRFSLQHVHQDLVTALTLSILFCSAGFQPAFSYSVKARTFASLPSFVFVIILSTAGAALLSQFPSVRKVHLNQIRSFAQLFRIKFRSNVFHELSADWILAAFSRAVCAHDWATSPSNRAKGLLSFRNWKTN